MPLLPGTRPIFRAHTASEPPEHLRTRLPAWGPLVKARSAPTLCSICSGMEFVIKMNIDSDGGSSTQNQHQQRNASTKHRNGFIRFVAAEGGSRAAFSRQGTRYVMGLSQTQLMSLPLSQRWRCSKCSASIGVLMLGVTCESGDLVREHIQSILHYEASPVFNCPSCSANLFSADEVMWHKCAIEVPRRYVIYWDCSASKRPLKTSSIIRQPDPLAWSTYSILAPVR